MFGFSTSDSKPDTEQKCYEEGEWYGEASGLVTEPCAACARSDCDIDSSGIGGTACAISGGYAYVSDPWG
ncbi:hypothetical protein DPMN_089233 [Dreissena polymorpha]|uniref:Uncharacterized protein n=1 Tax=Dreissena polymorpha TaxID=45954 RepID=A0A9D4KXV1_DREPO|nr:hypothetical protein DPMN_089233 [Dreissena polymorpha]